MILKKQQQKYITEQNIKILTMAHLVHVHYEQK